jgi:heat shock protein HslJ
MVHSFLITRKIPMPFKRLFAGACVLALSGCSSPPATTAATPAKERPSMATAAPGSSLAGTRWGGKAEGSMDPRNAPRLEFLADGRLAGYTGCNVMTGTWRMEGNELRFGPIISTKRGCPGPEGEVEKRVLAAMGEGSRVRREAGRLVVEGAGGERYEFAEIPVNR